MLVIPLPAFELAIQKMSGNTAKLYGPLAAVAAALATAVCSAEIPTDKMHLGPAPYLLYAAHPSMPVPPLASSCHASGCSLQRATVPAPETPQQPSAYRNFQESRSPSVEQVVRAVNGFVSDSLRGCSDSSILRVQISRPAHLLYASHLGSSAADFSMLRSSACQQPHFPVASFSSSTEASNPSIFSSSFAASEYIRSWHSKAKSPSKLRSDQGDKKGSSEEKREAAVTVVLLGWLGAEQKHLRRYADWYTERGINAVTFVIPMSDVMSLKVGGKAEQQIEHLAHHLVAWMSEDEDGKEKHLFFHTFSNTGWLTYGVILERLTQKNNLLLGNIKGCVVDSAPVPEPDPQVWASGFSAAFLKKKSVCTQKVEVSDILKDSSSAEDLEDLMESQLRPRATEQALVTMLEKFFSLFLQLPYVKKRLSEVVTVLSKQQPQCPQLYFYSTADKVIPAKSVESFIEEQRKAGRNVKACNLLWSPHVDHFRSFPDIYGYQLNSFIQECLSQWSAQKCG